MSAAKHTPGRLSVNPDGGAPMLGIDLQDGESPLPIAPVIQGFDVPQCKANARRLAAAWNACAKVSTEALEIGVVDTLMTALDLLIKRYKFDGIPNDSLATVQAAAAVLATARGVAS